MTLIHPTRATLHEEGRALLLRGDLKRYMAWLISKAARTTTHPRVRA